MFYLLCYINVLDNFDKFCASCILFLLIFHRYCNLVFSASMYFFKYDKKKNKQKIKAVLKISNKTRMVDLTFTYPIFFA